MIHFLCKNMCANLSSMFSSVRHQSVCVCPCILVFPCQFYCVLVPSWIVCSLFCIAFAWPLFWYTSFLCLLRQVLLIIPACHVSYIWACITHDRLVITPIQWGDNITFLNLQPIIMYKKIQPFHIKNNKMWLYIWKCHTRMSRGWFNDCSVHAWIYNDTNTTKML